jgi:hypothetical protein
MVAHTSSNVAFLAVLEAGFLVVVFGVVVALGIMLSSYTHYSGIGRFRKAERYGRKNQSV